MNNKSDTRDDAVSSVVGEMLLLTIALILTAVFAVSAFSFLPGDREDRVNVDVEISGQTLTFWHKGGDVVASDRLTASVYDGMTKRPVAVITPADAVFDLGKNYTVTVTGLKSGDEIRLSTERSILYTGVVSS